MRPQVYSKISDSRSHLAWARVLLHGTSDAIARLDRYCSLAAQLQRNGFELVACLQRDNGCLRRIQRIPSITQSTSDARSPVFKQSKKNSGRHLVPRSAVDINEIVAQLKSPIAHAVLVSMRLYVQRRIKTSRPLTRPYGRGRSSLNSLSEREFDESKHPRAPAGRPNGGEFISMQGRRSHSANAARPSQSNNFSEVQLAGVMTPAQVATLLAGNTAGSVASEVVGHHPLPISVLKEAYVRRRLTVAAFKLATETYFKNPNHGWKEYGGIHHKQYSATVENELQKLVTANKSKRIDKFQMENFLKNLTEGKGANGKTNSIIKDFNEAVLGISGDALRKTGETLEKAGARNIDDVIRRCDARRAFWANRFMGAAFVGVTGFLTANAQAAVTAVGNEHLRKAVEFLNEGKILEADREIFGPDRNGITGLISEIENNGSPLAAQNARKFFEELFTRLPNEKAEVIKILEEKHKDNE